MDFPRGPPPRGGRGSHHRGQRGGLSHHQNLQGPTPRYMAYNNMGPFPPPEEAINSFPQQPAMDAYGGYAYNQGHPASDMMNQTAPVVFAPPPHNLQFQGQYLHQPHPQYMAVDMSTYNVIPTPPLPLSSTPTPPPAPTSVPMPIVKKYNMSNMSYNSMENLITCAHCGSKNILLQTELLKKEEEMEKKVKDLEDKCKVIVELEQDNAVKEQKILQLEQRLHAVSLQNAVVEGPKVSQLSPNAQEFNPNRLETVGKVASVNDVPVVSAKGINDEVTSDVPADFTEEAPVEEVPKSEHVSPPVTPTVQDNTEPQVMPEKEVKQEVKEEVDWCTMADEAEQPPPPPVTPPQPVPVVRRGMHHTCTPGVEEQMESVTVEPTTIEPTTTEIVGDSEWNEDDHSQQPTPTAEVTRPDYHQEQPRYQHARGFIRQPSRRRESDFDQGSGNMAGFGRGKQRKYEYEEFSGRQNNFNRNPNERGGFNNRQNYRGSNPRFNNDNYHGGSRESLRDYSRENYRDNVDNSRVYNKYNNSRDLNDNSSRQHKDEPPRDMKNGPQRDLKEGPPPQERDRGDAINAGKRGWEPNRRYQREDNMGNHENNYPPLGRDDHRGRGGFHSRDRNYQNNSGGSWQPKPQQQRRYYPNIIKEVNGDLFTAPPDFSLAHCVAKDFRMGSGIAVKFRQEFKKVPELLDQNVDVGGCAYLTDKDRHIFYLVTKAVSNGKPTTATLRQSLVDMRDKCKQFGVTKLAMPRIGCGLDKLNWPEVKQIINEVFQDNSVEIRVFDFNLEGLPEGTNEGSKGVMVKYHIMNLIKIEAQTALVFFATEDGYMDSTANSLNNMFNFKSIYMKSEKTVGKVWCYDKSNDYWVYGLVVAKTSKDKVSFSVVSECIRELNKRAKKDEVSYIGIEHFKDWSDDDTLTEKITTLLRFGVHKPVRELWVCYPEERDDVHGMCSRQQAREQPSA